jgi:hypothetical protein
MGGVIGIAHVEAGDAQHSGDIVATTEAGKAISYTAPEETDISTINTARLYTDIGNSENKNFVLVDAVGNIYLGKPTQGSGVEYKQIPKPANYHTDYNQTLCDVSGDSVSCYRGRSAVGDLPEGLNFNSVAGYSIVTASFGSDSTSVANINGDTFGLDGFYVANGKLFGKSYKKLFYFEKKGDSYETREISQNVDFVAGGQKLYFIQNNGVFELDNETSDFHQIFHSNNIMPKSIYAVDGKTFIIASTSYDPTTTYAYLLNNEPDTNPGKRLIDIFPLSSKALSNTYSNDLVGDTLSINLIVTYRRNSPQQSIDGGELASQKESVLDALRAYDSGINEDNIQFVY